LIDEVSNLEMEDAFVKHKLVGIYEKETVCNHLKKFRKARKIIESDKMHKGITATAGGFCESARSCWRIEYS
jgi:uridine phosphorylase